MRIFKNTWFDRYASKEGIADSELKGAVSGLESGNAEANLGGNVYKVRIARSGKGKSGGYRVIVLFKKGERTFYIFGFAKSKIANIRKKDLKVYKEAAKEYFSLTDEQLAKHIKLSREKDIKWPIYDRNLHDVVQDAVLVHGDIVLIEGNWLLLNESGWQELMPFCDYSIFITADENMLKKRLIQRKVSGGASPEKAREFYIQSDRINILRALKNRVKSDCELKLGKNGKFSMNF